MKNNTKKNGTKKTHKKKGGTGKRYYTLIDELNNYKKQNNENLRQKKKIKLINIFQMKILY